MRIARYRDSQGQTQAGIVAEDVIQPLLATASGSTISLILEATDPAATAKGLVDKSAAPAALSGIPLLAPIECQEVWAAGVTYKRSKTARMEESESAATLYDKVYDSPRPELFFKATPNRVVGTGGSLRIRRDSHWNVPEPELALVLNSRLELVGFTIGNDMSSRDIEGENPLYLPQAKLYDACCGLGPWITLASAVATPRELPISLAVHRGNTIAFEGKTNVSQMARTFEDLISWLGRDNRFPNGAVLLTGTGIVPTADFTLQPGDVVEIQIEGLGTLRNPIVQG
jgi:2-dehydro-3-deoxy-D-arabinonate dehydratase